MKKTAKLLTLIFALMLTLPVFSAQSQSYKYKFNTLDGWDIRNGITYHQEGDSVILEKGNGLFFRRLAVDPGREYELKLTGGGNGIVCINWDDIVFEDPFKDSGEFKTKFIVPPDSRSKMMLRFLPKRGGAPFKLTTVELTPTPDPEGWVRHNRNALLKSVPSPKIVRGMSCGTLDEGNAKLLKDAYAKVVMLKFKDKSELDSISKQIDIALANGLLPIVNYDNNKDLKATWLAAKDSLGAKIDNVYAFVLSNDKTSRDEINALVKELRPQFKKSWFVFNTNAKNFPNLNPIDDLKVIYAATIKEAESLKDIKKFRNMTPAPFMAFGSSKMANAFEESHISWVVGSLPKNLKNNIAKIARPLHKGGNAQEQMQSLIKTFQKNRKPGQLEFAFITDTHYRSAKTVRNNSRAPAHSLEMAKVAKELKLDFVANGGDMVSGDKPRESSISDMREVVDAMATSGLPVFVTKGNHDDGVFWVLKKFKKSDPKLIVTDEDWYNACVKDFSIGRGAVGDKNFANAGYCYMDFPESKIRFINLCVNENTMEISKNGKFAIDSCGLYDFTPRQLNWLISQALNFSDKPDAKEWGVVLHSHCTVSKGLPNGSLLFGILNAFMTGSKYTGKTKGGNFPASVSCDFTQQGALKILMNISGHVHNDSISYSPLGFLTVRTLNDVSRDGKVMRVMGTPTESSWSLVTIDREKNEVTLLRYGAGVDIKAPLFQAPNASKNN